MSECFLGPGIVCNIYGDYSRLSVSFELFGAPLCVVNVHALHQSHGISNCIAFWLDTHDKILQYVPKLSNMILLGDFNTKLGGEISDCIGSFSADVPNKVGKALHRYLSKLKLTVPCTFSDHFKGDHTHTFTFHSGSTHRIDFIAVPHCLYGL